MENRTVKLKWELLRYFIVFGACYWQNDASGQIVRPPSYQSNGEPESSVKYTAIGQQDDCQVPPPAYSAQPDAGK